MSDLEKLIRTFAELDIGMRLESGVYDNNIYVYLEKGNKNVNGYVGFTCSFAFDSEGKFINVGIYE